MVLWWYTAVGRIRVVDMALTKLQEEASIGRALNQKWTVKLKQYDGADFDS